MHLVVFSLTFTITLIVVEELYKFDEFHSPLLRDSDIEAKPSVVFLGQYSTGKTSFIKYFHLDYSFLKFIFQTHSHFCMITSLFVSYCCIAL